MSTAELERELSRWRAPNADVSPSDAVKLSVDEALAHRNRGNLPDEGGRTLRLVLLIRDEADLERLDEKRRRYEPDYLDAPRWRREGSAPVNVVPLRAPGVTGTRAAWFDDPRMAELEGEWARTGAVGGVVVPAEWRAFVFKTIVALRTAGRAVTVTSIADSVERWLSPDEVRMIREALRRANRR